MANVSELTTSGCCQSLPTNDARLPMPLVNINQPLHAATAANTAAATLLGDPSGSRFTIGIHHVSELDAVGLRRSSFGDPRSLNLHADSRWSRRQSAPDASSLLQTRRRQGRAADEPYVFSKVQRILAMTSSSSSPGELRKFILMAGADRRLSLDARRLSDPMFLCNSQEPIEFWSPPGEGVITRSGGIPLGENITDRGSPLQDERNAFSTSENALTEILPSSPVASSCDYFQTSDVGFLDVKPSPRLQSVTVEQILSSKLLDVIAEETAAASVPTDEPALATTAAAVCMVHRP